jgi:hypothetical protein
VIASSLDRQRAAGGKWEPERCSGEDFFFKKMGYGHTEQSTVHVRYTPDNVAQKEIYVRPAGAPDIAHCSVWCTPDCPVSPDRGNFEIF